MGGPRGAGLGLPDRTPRPFSRLGKLCSLPPFYTLASPEPGMFLPVLPLQLLHLGQRAAGDVWGALGVGTQAVPSSCHIFP